MAKGTRNSRRNVTETGDNSGNNAANDRNAEVNTPAVNTARNAANTANAAAGAPAAPPLGMEHLFGLLTQVLERLPVPAPAPGVQPEVVEEPVNVNVNVGVEADPGERTPSYLRVMEHMQKLGTKFFPGGSKPVEADEWITRLERNFSSIRCPANYKKEIAAHYLEGDAHIWWQGVISRRGGDRNCDWLTFREEFTVKYFPPEAFDKMEMAFLELRQGNMTVREYEAEFNSLKKYAGHELERESDQIRRFMRGLRVDIQNRCLIRGYNTVAELVEKAAQQEAGLIEERKLLSKELHVQSKNVVGKNQSASSSKPTAGRSVCSTCGKTHSGVCRRASGACLRCGSMDHLIRNCPERDQTVKNPEGVAAQVVCYGCKEPGHYKNKCPKLAQQSGKRASDGPNPEAKRQNVMPRVYCIGGDNADASTSRPITGKPYPLP